MVNCQDKHVISHQTVDFPPNGFKSKFLNGYVFYLSKPVCFI